MPHAALIFALLLSAPAETRRAGHPDVGADGAPDHLLHPLVGRGGKLVRASWDEAMALVAGRFEELEKAGEA